MGKKDRYTYYLFDTNNNIVFEGQAKELAKKLFTSTNYIYVAWKKRRKILGYKLERKETNPYIPTTLEMVDKALEMACEYLEFVAHERTSKEWKEYFLNFFGKEFHNRGKN